MTKEDSPTDNSFATDYVGVTYLYSEAAPEPGGELPPVAERRVHDPARMVFQPGWSVPLDSFSFQNMTVSKHKEDLEGKRIPNLRIRAEGTDIFGPHSVGFRFDLPDAGTYAVSLAGLGGPDQAIVQIYRSEVARGAAVDLYRPRREPSGPSELAELSFEEGDNVVPLKLIGRNPDSSGLGLDLVAINFERVP